MTLLEFQLRALKYPHTVDPSNTEAIRKLVIWLENLKIREYKIQDRKALADIQSSDWDAAFKKYLQDLECPVPAGELLAAVQWLVAFALNLEYEDNADKLSAPSRTAAPAGAGPGLAGASDREPSSSGSAVVRAAGGPGCGREDEVFPDLTDPRVATVALQLIRAVQSGATAGGGPTAGAGGGGGGDGDGTADIVRQLQVASELLVSAVGPAVQGGVWSKGRAPKQALAGVPLGFDVEDSALATAATALRLLYIRDLRRLQSQIDHAVVEMQEYTANPKTDSSLGKVGR